MSQNDNTPLLAAHEKAAPAHKPCGCSISQPHFTHSASTTHPLLPVSKPSSNFVWTSCVFTKRPGFVHVWPVHEAYNTCPNTPQLALTHIYLDSFHHSLHSLWNWPPNICGGWSITVPQNYYLKQNQHNYQSYIRARLPLRNDCQLIG